MTNSKNSDVLLICCLISYLIILFLSSAGICWSGLNCVRFEPFLSWQNCRQSRTLEEGGRMDCKKLKNWKTVDYPANAKLSVICEPEVDSLSECEQLKRLSRKSNILTGSNLHICWSKKDCNSIPSSLNFWSRDWLVPVLIYLSIGSNFSFRNCVPITLTASIVLLFFNCKSSKISFFIEELLEIAVLQIIKKFLFLALQRWYQILKWICFCIWCWSIS